MGLPHGWQVAVFGAVQIETFRLEARRQELSVQAFESRLGIKSIQVGIPFTQLAPTCCVAGFERLTMV